MKIVVAGGTGFLGVALVAALRRKGHEVVVLTRRPIHGGEVRWPAQAAGSDNPIAGADAVIGLAGASIADRRWRAAQKHAIRASRLESTRTLVRAIKEAHPAPQVFISGSAVGYYGCRDDERLTEAAPPGSDFLAGVCREWEAEAQAAADVTRVVVLRTGVVLDKDGGALPKLALPFRLFAGGPIGSGRQYVSWIHRADWVSLACWALAEAVSGPVNATAPEPVTNAEFGRTLGRVLDRPSWLPTPGFALRLALGEMADALILGGQRVVPQVAQASGFTFAYPTLESALQQIYR